LTRPMRRGENPETRSPLPRGGASQPGHPGVPERAVRTARRWMDRTAYG